MLDAFFLVAQTFLSYELGGQVFFDQLLTVVGLLIWLFLDSLFAR